MLSGLHVVRSCWCAFFFFARTVELAGSIIGGVCLYGSDICGPFLPEDVEGSRVNIASLKWIHGFGGARPER